MDQMGERWLMDRHVVLVGANGSMGRRYRAILRWLRIPVTTYDIQDEGCSPAAVLAASETARAVIIATPTRTHSFYGNLLWDCPAPLLIEKPMSKNLKVVEHMLNRPSDITTMAQYAMLDNTKLGETTRYDHYHSGSDGLAWDCMTLLGLARGHAVLNDESPIWDCTLNGQRLTLEDVQISYVKYLEAWLGSGRSPVSRDWMMLAHERAEEWARLGIVQGVP